MSVLAVRSGARLAIAAGLSLSLGLSSAPSVAVAPADKDCIPACVEQAASPYCLAAGFDPVLSRKLAALGVRLGQEDRVIEAAWLRSNFDVAVDPCARGDTAFASGAWVNTGAACVISSQLDIGGGARVPVAINIPPVLMLDRSTMGGFRVMRPRTAAVMLGFGEPGWQRDWGGEISYAAFDARRVLFQVPSGCIAIDLTPP